jgi:protein tyrosine phosphatase (PTP) superfamily phosphohydrolase (DUF442 family)
VQILLPEAQAAERPRDRARLYPPESVPATPAIPSKPPESREPPPAPSPMPRIAEERKQLPKVAEEPKQSPSLPVGIPQFAAVREGVSSGLKPLLDGGLDWLQANGYRTVLRIRLPGEEDAADRREVEKRAMRYLSLEVSPQTLTAALVDQFNRLVGDAGNYPLFVYDRDGSLAGGLWYLHFRTVDRSTDESARARASRHGLREDGEGQHKAMWLAIQRFLSKEAS